MSAKEVMKERRFSVDKMQKVNLFDTKNMFCDVYCLNPGQQQKVHAHANEDKIYYVLEGTGRFILGEQEKTMIAGEIMLAASGQDHGVVNDSDDKLSVLVFMAPNPNYG